MRNRKDGEWLCLARPIPDAFELLLMHQLDGDEPRWEVE
jgi:hypothetical protein